MTEGDGRQRLLEEIVVSRRNDVRVFKLEAGSFLDGENVDILMQDLRRKLDNERDKKVYCLDLSNVNYICSQAIGFFLTFNRLLLDRFDPDDSEGKWYGLHIILPDALRENFQATKLEKQFCIYSDMNKFLFSSMYSEL